MAGGVALGSLEAELAVVVGQLNALQARLVGLTAAALEAGAWEQWGIHTPSHWLAWKAGLSAAHAHQVVAVAGRRGELPVTFAGFEAGELSMDQVVPIAAKVPGWADAEVAALARHATVAQLRRLTSRYSFDASEPAGEDLAPDRAARRERHVRLAPCGHGQWRVSGVLDHDEALKVEAALFEARDAVATRTGATASLADGLVELAERSLDGVTGTARRDRYRVHLHADVEHVTDDHGNAVPDWFRDLVCCDTRRTVTWYDAGRPVRVGDTADTVPAWVRRHVRRRDGHCRVPGCHARIFDIHHVVHRSDGGTHDVSNVMALCPFHHRLHHQGVLGITGDAERPDALVFTDARGRPLRPGPSVHGPTGPPPPARGTWRHASGERLHLDAVHFNRPPPAA